MANIIAQLRDWLVQNRPFHTNWLQKDAAYPSEVSESLAELPSEIAQQLMQLAKEQPSHPHDLHVIQEALSAAIQGWQADSDLDNNSNSLIILSSPVSITTRILMDSVADWAAQNSLAINLLDWIKRPIDAEQIQSEMNKTLQQSQAETDRQNIAIIPNLSWCFLRSVEGLDGIDFLRDHLLSDHTQFWVIGSGQVGWRYLNSVLKLKAHCGEVIKLPRLSGEQLQDWLMPIIDTLGIRFDQTSIQERLQEMGDSRSQAPSFGTLTAFWEEIKATARSLFRDIQHEAQSFNSEPADENDPEWARYFDRLADVSEGVSAIALQLFITSICYEEIEPDTAAKVLKEPEAEEVEALQSPEPPPSHRLVARLPSLPELPELNQNALYILYSLLVHGDLTLDALAESLGGARQIINDRVQVLRKTGLVEQKGQVVKVNPVHYPRIKQKLTSNNFIIEVPK